MNTALLRNLTLEERERHWYAENPHGPEHQATLDALELKDDLEDAESSTDRLYEEMQDEANALEKELDEREKECSKLARELDALKPPEQARIFL